MLKILLGLLMFTAGMVVRAADDSGKKRLVLHAKVEVSVESYLEDSDVFELAIPSEPAVGPNFATPDALKKAAGVGGKKADFVKKMVREPHAVWVLKSDLPLLFPEEVVARRKKHVKK